MDGIEYPSMKNILLMNWIGLDFNK